MPDFLCLFLGLQFHLIIGRFGCFPKVLIPLLLGLSAHLDYYGHGMQPKDTCYPCVNATTKVTMTKKPKHDFQVVQETEMKWSESLPRGHTQWEGHIQHKSANIGSKIHWYFYLTSFSLEADVCSPWIMLPELWPMWHTRSKKLRIMCCIPRSLNDLTFPVLTLPLQWFSSQGYTQFWRPLQTNVLLIHILLWQKNVLASQGAKNKREKVGIK